MDLSVTPVRKIALPFAGDDFAQPGAQIQIEADSSNRGIRCTGEPLRFRVIPYTGTGAAAVPVDGDASTVDMVVVNSGASITLGGGGATELVGIEYLDETDTAIAPDQNKTDGKFFRTAPGVRITVLHNRTTDLNSDPLPATQRILTSSTFDFDLEPGNTQAFYGYVSRDVGGSAEVTSIAVTESGTLPDGAPTLSASGNDIEIELTATFDGDIDYVVREELDSILA